MGKTAILAIRIIGDATEAVASLDQVDGRTRGMQASMDKASAASAVALGAIAAAATAAGNAASEAQQAAGAVDSVFKGYAAQVQEYAAAADQAVGLSETAYSNLAAVIGSQLKNMGVELDQVSGRTDWLIGLGADLSATFGGTTADAVAALSSLLRGERDPIERYGVSINQAAIDAELAAMGLEGLTGEAEKNAQLQATLAILTRQTADAQGQFAREGETAAGQQQRATAAWENASAALGVALLPLMAQGALILADLAGWVSENTEVVGLLAGGIGTLAAGVLVINGAMKTYAAIQAVQTAAQWASNAAWLASPITWIVLAIVAAVAAVIAVVVLLIQNWDAVKRKAEEVWGAVVGWFRQVWDWWSRLQAQTTPRWLTDLLGLSGSTVSARVAVEEPQMPMMTARMAYTADETMTAYAQPAALASTSAGLSASSVGGLGGSDRAAGDTYYVEVNFNGMVTDEEAAAREIRRVLAQSDRTNGRVVAAGVGT